MVDQIPGPKKTKMGQLKKRETEIPWMATDHRGRKIMRTVATEHKVPQTLPAIGFSRWEQLKHFIPVSRETWRKLVREGRAPQPQRWTERCTVYSNEEVWRWMKDPAAYQVQKSSAL